MKWALGVVVLVGVVAYFMFGGTRENAVKLVQEVVQKPKIYSGVGYVALDSEKFEVQDFVRGIGGLLAFRITPSGENLLAIDDKGWVWRVEHSGEAAKLFKTEIEPRQLFFSSRFVLDQKIFLIGRDGLYVTSLADETHTIERVELLNLEGKLVDGVGVEISGKPQLLLLTDKDIVLVSEMGGMVKQRATGLKGPGSMVRNLFDNEGRFLVADERIMYTKLVDIRDRSLKVVDFSGFGEISDPNNLRVKNMVLNEVGMMVGGMVFHPGKGAIPRSLAQENNVLALVGDEIRLGRLRKILGQPEFGWETLVVRNGAALEYENKLVGIDVDPSSGDIYFGDNIEGKIYKLVVK